MRCNIGNAKDFEINNVLELCALLRLHQAGVSVVDPLCFDLAQHERSTTLTSCSF